MFFNYKKKYLKYKCCIAFVLILLNCTLKYQYHLKYNWSKKSWRNYYKERVNKKDQGNIPRTKEAILHIGNILGLLPNILIVTPPYEKKVTSNLLCYYAYFRWKFISSWLRTEQEIIVTIYSSNIWILGWPTSWVGISLQWH